MKNGTKVALLVGGAVVLLMAGARGGQSMQASQDAAALPPAANGAALPSNWLSSLMAPSQQPGMQNAAYTPWAGGSPAAPSYATYPGGGTSPFSGGGSPFAAGGGGYQNAAWTPGLSPVSVTPGAFGGGSSPWGGGGATYNI